MCARLRRTGVEKSDHRHPWLLSVGREWPCSRTTDDGDETRAASFDHLVGGDLQRQRNGQAEQLGALEIDDQFESGWLYDRNVPGPLAIEHSAGIDARLAPPVRDAGSI